MALAMADMADYEFQESEVIFSDNHEFESCLDFRHHPIHNQHELRGNNPNLKKKKKMGINNTSVPVKIPNNIVFDRFGGADDDSEGGDYYKEEEWEFNDGEMVPPHVIVRRRIAGKMAFSVCTGNGRTLKGRDLSQVRNSILRMTGFLEA